CVSSRCSGSVCYAHYFDYW
nr:immunoglobulin heavy chain junction region [Macaca mulatta]MOY21581.1 immunoglobulin heavy chain junction region [Macaca mulatta]MOY21986.1 immunoglobulin heavy chain junction region [Macaca mulatta]MOY22005.1 immunoglobulin heavy chain junction region [Macaca mulatta]MOY22899.1 immunoglobulin heavy chain junction region [Macaca mulatta]